MNTRPTGICLPFAASLLAIALVSAYLLAFASTPCRAAGTGGGAGAQTDGASLQQPEFTSLKASFVPGDRTLFYDDFTDMAAGDAPPHFKIRGAAPDLRASGAMRQLTVTGRGSMFPNLTALPQNFTFEAEIQVESPKRALINLILSSKGKQIFLLTTSAMANQAEFVASLRAPYQELGRVRTPTSWAAPAKIALWVQNGRLRVFLNGDKQLDFNQVTMPAIDQIELAHDFYGASQSIGYRMVRFAESTPDFSQVIASSGRFVTHGLLFDTDSARLKPESGPVLQLIARGLEANPDLKLLIEGHTDSVGAAAHNLELSKRRAEAVKTVLSGQFRIDASRLTTTGLGASKPIDTNDTPQGRAQNRRVELVRQ